RRARTSRVGRTRRRSRRPQLLPRSVLRRCRHSCVCSHVVGNRALTGATGYACQKVIPSYRTVAHNLPPCHGRTPRTKLSPRLSQATSTPATYLNVDKCFEDNVKNVART